MKTTIIKLVIIFSLLNIQIGCSDEISTRNYPRIRTLEVSNISTEGATFNAQIIFRGDFKIKSYGFVWSEGYPVLGISDKQIYYDNIQDKKFSSNITTKLKDGAVYNVRAFIQTDYYTVYGDSISFLSRGSKIP